LINFISKFLKRKEDAMMILPASGLNFPKRIGNKTAFQQARILSRQAIARDKKIRYIEWPVFNFSIDKALSNLTCQAKLPNKLALL
jgi:hypothetical protein